MRSQQSFEQLTDLFKQAAAPKGIAPQQIHAATLEFGPSLETQLTQLGQSLTAGQAVQILPLFLLRGTHMMKDIPDAVESARQQVPHIQFNVRPHIGSHSGILALLRDRISTDYPWVLLAHGSRYPGGNAAVEQMSAVLGTQSAYWSVSPKLEVCLTNLVEKGHQTIGVLPYFLFTGSITNAILEQVYQLRCRFNTVNIRLASPIHPTPALAQLLIDLI